jgi:Endomembrane protein 70
MRLCQLHNCYYCHIVTSITRLYKLFGGRNWKRNTATTALLFPGAVFSIFWALNITMWFEASVYITPHSIVYIDRSCSALVLTQLRVHRIRENCILHNSTAVTACVFSGVERQLANSAAAVS